MASNGKWASIDNLKSFVRYFHRHYAKLNENRENNCRILNKQFFPIGWLLKGCYFLPWFLRVPLLFGISLIFAFCDWISNRKRSRSSKFIPRLMRGPAGLKNDSTNCYMNAMIQAVATSEVVIKRLQNLKENNSHSKPLTLFLDLLSGVCREGNRKEIIEENTKLMKDLIKSANWNKSSQQDAFELFAALVKAIHDDLKQSNSSIKMPMKLQLVHRFNNNPISDKVQDHLGLSLGLCGDYATQPGVSVEYLIDQYFMPTLIDDDPNKTTRMFFYNHIPEVFLLHIQANKWDPGREEMVKPEYYIIYDKEMNVELQVVCDGDLETRKEKATYKLKSIVKHSGNISGGHYVTHREYKDKWYLMNDEYVDEEYFNKNIIPYIMIYEKMPSRASQ